jgi:Fe-S cluster assembly protein SufD
MSAAASKSVASAVDRYRALFDARFSGDDALTTLRRAALDRFTATGFPTSRDEDWKYTNLRRFESRSFALAERGPVAPHEENWIADAGARIALVNGRAISNLSSPQPPGVTVLTFGQWIANSPGEVADFLAKNTDPSAPAFDALNTAFFEDGVLIDIADGVTLDQPIYIVHQWTGASSCMAHLKVFVRAGRRSQLTLIEHYLGAEEAESFTNAVTHFDLQSGARVSHYRLQQESTRGFHMAHVEARLNSDSRYMCHDVAFGSTLARTHIGASLLGTGADAQLRGLFAPNGNQHLDTYTLVDHAAAHTVSTEEYRGIAGGRGRGVFRGKVIVRQDAQKIDSRQSSRNLLLSPTAEIDTRPELEIYANDVKCSHGATTGQLDATALFYLRSRGLSDDEARRLLIRAFAESILSGMESQPVKHYLEKRLHERFASGQESP